MKYLKLFENFKKIFVGYHCSPSDEIIDEYIGEIKEDYFDRYTEILNAIKNDYKEASDFLNDIDTMGDDFTLEESDLSFDIWSFL